MDDTRFLATWDDTGNVGVVNLTIAELKEFTSSAGSDKGEHINFKKKHRSHWYCACVGLSEIRQEILMETDDLVFKLRLRFEIWRMASEDKRVPQIEEDLSLLNQRSMCYISA